MPLSGCCLPVTCCMLVHSNMYKAAHLNECMLLYKGPNLPEILLQAKNTSTFQASNQCGNARGLLASFHQGLCLCFTVTLATHRTGWEQTTNTAHSGQARAEPSKTSSSSCSRTPHPSHSQGHPHQFRAHIYLARSKLLAFQLSSVENQLPWSP